MVVVVVMSQGFIKLRLISNSVSYGSPQLGLFSSLNAAETLTAFMFRSEEVRRRGACL